MYDNPYPSQQDVNIHNDIKYDTRSPISNSTEKFYESFSELPDNDDEDNSNFIENAFGINIIEPDETVLDEWSSKDSVHKSDRGLSDLSYTTENEDDKDTTTETATSVLEHINIGDQYDEDLKKELTFAKRHIEENINLQIKNVRENIKNFNEFKKLCEEDKLSDLLSLDSFGKLNVKKNKAEKNNVKYENTLFVVWSKLISFAYQVLQLNNGKHVGWGSRISKIIKINYE